MGDILLTDEVLHLTVVVGIQDLLVQEEDTDLDPDLPDLTDPHHVGLCVDHGARHRLTGVEVSKYTQFSTFFETRLKPTFFFQIGILKIA